MEAQRDCSMKQRKRKKEGPEKKRLNSRKGK